MKPSPDRWDGVMMMNVDTFRSKVLEHNPRTTCEVSQGYLIFTKQTPFAGAVKVKVDVSKIPQMDETVPLKLFQGYEVEQMTRVTGYFSKVSGWNKGKIAELSERYRNENL